jgi:tripartite-type tricarboxylate transporter receptor subunit TctC
MRILAQQLSTQMGQPFVVENKPGASFVLGTMDIVKAPPDGYTRGYGNLVSLAINKSLLGSVPYDVEKDLTLVSNCVRVFNLLAVNNKLPINMVQELIDYAKKNPGRLTTGSSGNGTTGHLGRRALQGDDRDVHRARALQGQPARSGRTPRPDA